MKKELNNKEKIFKYLVMIYFIISPIFDTIFLYSHYTTLIRVFVLLCFAFFIVLTNKDSRKNFLFLILYYLALIVFLAIDYFHAKGFSSLVPGNFNYSLISEATTIIKLAMPFTILFILKYVNFTKEEFFRVVNCWVFVIAGSIVLLNILGLSLGSYTNEFTKYSIFSWGQDLSVNDIATKGWFCYPNQMGIILILLLVLSFYETVFVKKKYILNIVLISLACLMLGTRLVSYGGILVLIFLFISYIIYILIKHMKINKILFLNVIVIIFWLLMLLVSPNSSRVQEIKNNKMDSSENISIKFTDDIVDDSLGGTNDYDLKYIEDNINKNLVGEQFYKSFYPYNYDTEFWLDIVARQASLNLNYRKLEIMIINRVIEIDNRKSDIWFGISNSIIQNIVNVEMDFVLQFYSFGVIGMVVCLLFYVYMSCKVLIKVFKNKSFLNISILFCLGVFILGVLMSGNTLNFLATIIPFSFIVGASGKYKD